MGFRTLNQMTWTENSLKLRFGKGDFSAVNFSRSGRQERCERSIRILQPRFDQSARNRMRRSERKALIANQGIGDSSASSSRRPARASRRSASNSAVAIAAAISFTARVRVAEHRVHERLQVVLAVHDVAEGRVVDGGDDRLRLTERLAGNRAARARGRPDSASAA